MFVFNPLTGKLEKKDGGYTGDLLDSTGTVIATVVNGLIKTVVTESEATYALIDNSGNTFVDHLNNVIVYQ